MILTKRKAAKLGGGGDEGDHHYIAMAGFPARSLDKHTAKLLAQGHRLCIVTQVGSIDTTKSSSSSSSSSSSLTMARAVDRVLTPGTLVEDDLLVAARHNFVAAVVVDAEEANEYDGGDDNDSNSVNSNRRWGLAYADVSTGCFRCTGGVSAAALRRELADIDPVEVLVVSASASSGGSGSTKGGGETTTPPRLADLLPPGLDMEGYSYCVVPPAPPSPPFPESAPGSANASTSGEVNDPMDPFSHRAFPRDLRRQGLRQRQSKEAALDALHDASEAAATGSRLSVSGEDNQDDAWRGPSSSPLLARRAAGALGRYVADTLGLSTTVRTGPLKGGKAASDAAASAERGGARETGENEEKGRRGRVLLKPLVWYSASDTMTLDASTIRALEVFANVSQAPVGGSRNSSNSSSNSSSGQHMGGGDEGVASSRGAQHYGSLRWSMDTTKTSAGGRLLTEWLQRPLLNCYLIRRRHDIVDDLASQPLIRDIIRWQMGEVKDVERICGRVVSGRFTPRCLVLLGSTLVQSPLVLEEAACLPSFHSSSRGGGGVNGVNGGGVERQEWAEDAANAPTFASHVMNTLCDLRAADITGRTRTNGSSGGNDDHNAGLRDEKGPNTPPPTSLDRAVALGHMLLSALVSDPPTGAACGYIRPGVDAEVDRLTSLVHGYPDSDEHSSNDGGENTEPLRSIKEHRDMRAILELEQAQTGLSTLKLIEHRMHGVLFALSAKDARAMESKTEGEFGGLPNHFQLVQKLKAGPRYTTPSLGQRYAELHSARTHLIARERQVLQRLADGVVEQIAPVRGVAEALTVLDVLAAFAQNAVDEGYCRPIMSPRRSEIDRRGRVGGGSGGGGGGRIEDSPVVPSLVQQAAEEEEKEERDLLWIEDGRHPVLELLLPPGMFCPNSVYLGGSNEAVSSASSSASSSVATSSSPDNGSGGGRHNGGGVEPADCAHADVIILTGPNAGGKSVYLRQIGLIQLMAQVGSFVPASSASLCVCDRIFARVGAWDDVVAGQSTFTLEMKECANILEHSTRDSLVRLLASVIAYTYIDHTHTHKDAYTYAHMMSVYNAQFEYVLDTAQQDISMPVVIPCCSNRHTYTHIILVHTHFTHPRRFSWTRSAVGRRRKMVCPSRRPWWSTSPQIPPCALSSPPTTTTLLRSQAVFPTSPTSAQRWMWRRWASASKCR